MFDIAAQVSTWLSEGRAVTLAQVVETRGFSSRDPAAAIAWPTGSPGEAVGALVAGMPGTGIATPPLDHAAPGLQDVVISDADAVAAGLACGGRARVLVSDARTLGVALWDRLVDCAPTCLVTTLSTGETIVYTPDTIREAPGELPRLFGRGASTTALHDDVAIVSLWPVPTLVVVGDGLIAQALSDTAALLGWSATCTLDVDTAVTLVGGLHRSDAFVVLSHSRDVDGPTLAAALAADVGYVGALGSRRTQALRREWLTGHGVPEAEQDRVHGPAGLDIDAHTPAEIAISIVAEILGSRAHSSGGAGGQLRARTGPVHVSGVQAPPPRY